MTRFVHRRTGKVVKAEPGTRHHAQLSAHRQWAEASASAQPPAPATTEAETDPEPEPESDTPAATEIRHSGGPWFEVVVDGEVVDKVLGREAAEQRLAELS